MLNKYLNYDRLMKREEKASKHINILQHYDDSTLLDKSGKLIKIFKLKGLNYFTKGDQLLDLHKNRRNNLLKSFSSDFAIYFWHVRRKVVEYPQGEFEEGFAKEVNEKYKQNIEKRELFRTDLFIALMTKQPQGLINKGFHFLKQLNYVFDKTAKKAYLAKKYQELNDATLQLLNTLSDYQCELLKSYQKNSISFSKPLEFISQLINCDHFVVPLNVFDAAKVLARKRMFFNRRSGTLEIRNTMEQKKFAAFLSIKAYQPVTHQGILDEFNKLPIEYVITQSFRFYDKHAAKAKLRDQQQDMMQSKEESASLTDEIDDAYDDTASGEVGYGIHQFTFACFADTQEDLNKYVGLITAKFSDIDIVCVRENIASECAYWSQLPGNFSYVVRPADISTKNMAAFASLHNIEMGKIKGNHWADAVTVFETITGSPYYFNFHYKDVGNFLVFGAMGSGKTVLIGFLILQSMKFGGKRIFFDKDRGLEILVRAMGGVYETIKPGQHTGFNPCLLADTSENRKFLSLLFKKMLSINGSPLTAQDSEIIENAIGGLYRLHNNERQLCHISSFFGARKADSLRNRFDQWHSNGSHAWVFDNPEDSLNLDSQVIGFDLGHILNGEAETKTPALMYLIYRIEKAIEGMRGILFCDEGWLALNDDYFKKLIDDWSRTPRKKDNIFGLATQVANDTVNSVISKSINESSFCKIFFPNPSADKKVFIQDLGLSEHEYELIKTLPDDKHCFLLNHGRGINKESVVLTANLAGLEDAIAIISARESTLKIMDEVIAEVGSDPKIWVPIFHEKLKGLNHVYNA